MEKQTIKNLGDRHDQKSLRRIIVLLIIVFSGVGIRVMQFEGAIIVWALLISFLNINELSRVNFLLLLLSCVILFSLYLIFLLKGAVFRKFMAAVVYCSYVFLLPYCRNPRLLYADLKVLLDLFMKWNILSLLPMIFLEPYLTSVAFGFDSYKTLMYVFWFVPFGGPDIFYGLRPCGITWEPGIWQMFLNLNLLIAIFEWRSIRYVILSLISVIGVFSTSGILTLGVCLILSTFVRRSNVGFFKISAIFASIMPFIPLLSDNIVEKISGKHMGSGMTRVSDFFTGGLELIKNPILGSSQENLVATMNNELIAIKSFFWGGNYNDGAYEFYLEVANCNGYMIFLVEWGLVIGLPLLWLTFYTKVFPTKRMNLAFLAIIYISMSSEPISNTALFYSLVILGGYQLVVGRKSYA
jgi:hypothetical protein